MPRKLSSRSRLGAKRAGSWNSTGPSLGPSSRSRDSISSMLLADLLLSRFQWVMNLEAFQAKRKSAGVCARQAFTAASEGVR